MGAAGLSRAVAFWLAVAAAGALALREVGARLVLLRDGTEDVPAPASGDPDVLAEVGGAALEAGRIDAAASAAAGALARRPRDPSLLRLAAAAEPRVGSALRLLLAAARMAPWDVHPATDALRRSLDAAREAVVRAAAVEESARRMRAAGVVEGVADVEQEVVRLRSDAEAFLDTALAAWRAVSPTARGRRFLADDVAQVEGLLRELEALP